jgi:hypothetical protein
MLTIHRQRGAVHVLLAVVTLCAACLGGVVAASSFLASPAATPAAFACDNCDGWLEPGTGDPAHQLGAGANPSCCNSGTPGDPGECGHGKYVGEGCQTAHEFCFSGCDDTVAKIDPSVFDDVFRAAEAEDWKTVSEMVADHGDVMSVLEARSAIEFSCVGGSMAGLIPVPSDVLSNLTSDH